jgi:uncharacterized protein YaiL (DUF2058 family)
MAGSLRDQLVKAGVATSGQAKKAERQKRAEEQARRQGRGGKNAKSAAPDASSPANARQRARDLIADKVKRDRATAAVRNEKNLAKSLRAEIKQIILQNDQRTSEAKDDDVPYNFVHGKKIKRIYVPRAQQQQLGSGDLVIVNNDGRYHLLSKNVAEQIRTRDPKRIIAAHDPSAPSTPDDEYYAKFEIPDDLDW